MAPLIASIAAFALGLLFLPMMFRGIRVRETAAALKAGLVGGALSVTLGKALVALLTVVFLPIALLGPIGVFLIHSGVNASILWGTSHLSDSVEFDGLRTTGVAALALTALQTLVRLAG